MALLLLLLSHGVHRADQQTRRPWYIRCQDSSECGAGWCCSVMEGRYMVPMCLPMKRRPGEECSARSVNVTARYPPSIVVSLTEVYLEGCPCQGDMACKEGLCRPRDVDSNSLLEQ